ncbi:pentapeptide repeat-containing protein [Mycobacterium sp. Root265]|uniref:pentapeptide repeat-containing protein n=1 Tax=Mycobacterium sp. Root265 TaxID=1736504 RepID=UPI000AA29329|nr:pentapeptide repeat-containing protein [Mycobacterium sp. Root265]
MTASDTGEPSGGGNFTNTLAVIALVASIASVIFTTVSDLGDLALSGKGQLADRFSNTVELLNSDGTGKRLGAIYALQQIAKESPDYRNAVKNALAGFVRVDSRKLGHECRRVGLAENPDLAAAVEILADQKPENSGGSAAGANKSDSGRWANNATSFVDLTGACLYARNLERSRLDYARLNGADLGDSAFDSASLRHARLGASGSEILTNGSDYVEYIDSIAKGGLNIAGASFRDANLSDSDLSRIWVRRSCGPRPSLWFDNADLTDSTMWQSVIPDAVFAGTTMDGMKITASSFVGAEFNAETSMRDITVVQWINFEQADLRGVDLRGLTFEDPLSGQPWPKINFRNANLRGADLRGLNLVDAEFSGADLREAKLDRDQLHGARWDGWTLWPDEVRPTVAPTVVPSPLPPQKPDLPAGNPQPTPPPSLPDPKDRVTIETSPDGVVRIDIAPPSASRPGSEGGPSPDSTNQISPTDGADQYDNNLYSYPGYFNDYYYGAGNYSNYNSLNYLNNDRILNQC